MLLGSLPVFVLSNVSFAQNAATQPHTFTILQLNDVYEISPLANGKEGGMARVASVRKQLAAKDPNTFAVLAGDFLSPSFLGTLKYKDPASGTEVKIAGRQMVEVMNSAGIDLVTFGNHEFDIAQGDLQKRINESHFDWINSNVNFVLNGAKKPFTKATGNTNTAIPPYTIRTITYPDGQKVRVGIIGSTIAFTKAPWVSYEEELSTFRNVFAMVKPQCDVVLGLTHLSKKMDSTLATQLPGLHLIMGGHEHENMKIPAGGITVCKADANVKTVYIHNISYTPANKQVNVQSYLKKIDETVPTDGATDLVVQKWMKLADSIMRSNGFDPQKVLMTTTVPLDGRESEIRNHPTNYTRLIANALLYAAPYADAALYNSGSLRIDDELSGSITQYDVLRSLPYGGAMVMMNFTGVQLDSLLHTGTVLNTGIGGYLQLGNITNKHNKWYIKGKKLKAKRSYNILLPEYLALGNEERLGWLGKLSYCKPNAFRGNQLVNDIKNIVMAYMLSGGR